MHRRPETFPLDGSFHDVTVFVRGREALVPHQAVPAGPPRREHLDTDAGLRGFTGSGRLYRLDDLVFARLGFQSSRWNSVDEVECTVNLMVVGRAHWAGHRAAAPHLPEVPSPGTEYGRHARVWWRRLGHLMPVNGDTWWTVTSHAAAGVADEVVAAVVEDGLPAMPAQRAAVPERAGPGDGVRR
ncbi:hypothetical protein Daura_43695 [Dactylosporangium aurantiacum]|uniref:Uncharacterized protein n=1 Tax=Dactylosporangium aurantiacum TaxID=35754 RepID=A0A9Q9ML25_9ACTN|nr:hypothetical protein [Dactylosporangium aurantiacum]MDG6102317.1 hypothetical protein [Dactylosporangium aurantiacum]UWZ53382.1 hypothetical protein Daura_43695 [Dactylosporangium aurantiacum]